MKRMMALLLALLLCGMVCAMAEVEVDLGNIDLNLSKGDSSGETSENPTVTGDLELELSGVELPGLDDAVVDTDMALDLELSSDGALAIEATGETAADAQANAVVGDIVTVNGINYEITDSGARVQGPSWEVDRSTITEIVIPSTVEGHAVTSIGNSAFSGLVSLKTVTLPEGLTAIGGSAFFGCASLASLTIPSSVTSCGNGLFSGCNSLEEMTAPACCFTGGYTSLKKATIVATGAYELPESAFSGCTSLASLALPESLIAIGDYAFSGCTSLASLTLPESLTAIGNYTFMGCTSLASLTLPEDLTAIGDSAFCGCTSLASLTIPSSVTSIGTSLFAGCISLELTVPSSIFQNISINSVKSVIVTGDGPYKISDGAFEGSSLSSITLPEGLTSIGKYAFSRCSSLTCIILPEGLTSIGDYAFADCSSLASVTIPASVTSFGRFVFEGCEALADLTASFNTFLNLGDFCQQLKTATVTASGAYKIPNNFFIYGQLTSITLPEGLTAIGDGAFCDCEHLKHVTLPEGLQSIGRKAFNYCVSLEAIDIPSTVTSIGENAFNNCRSLSAIVIPKGVTSIKDSTFYDCGSLTSVTLPEGLTSIGNGAFIVCSSLKSITLPEGLTSIASFAFSNCKALTDINLPDGLTSFGDSVFSYCTSLTTIDLPDGLTSLKDTFWHCSSLKHVSLPNNLVTIGETTFKDCTALEEVNLPKGVVNIAPYAFSNCSALKEIIFPANVSSIGKHAFWGCASLKSIQIPANVKNIGDYAFMGCTGLEEAIMESGVKSLGDLCFAQCVSLKRIMIPKTVSKIGQNALMKGKSMKGEKWDYKTDKIFPPCLIPPITKLPNLIIYGEKDSAAQTYAKKNNIPFTVLPTGVTIKQGKSANMLAGEKLALTAVIAPEGATTKLKWSSSNEKVATVSSKGVVKAIGKGKATITVTTDNGKKATFKVNVPTAPASVKLSKTSATVVVGGSLKLKAAVSPSGAKTKLTWSSSNEKVAKVTQKGVVSALKKGSATITVKTSNGLKATCKITVPTPPRKVQFARKSYTVKVGKTVKLGTKLTPSGAKTTFTWSTSDKKIATVTSKGVVKGLKKGSATITVKTANGLNATVKVTVE